MKSNQVKASISNAIKDNVPEALSTLQHVLTAGSAWACLDCTLRAVC
jgi:hypothetical protein